MQYNKYVLALALLASSAIAVTLPDFETLADGMLATSEKTEYVKNNADFVSDGEVADVVSKATKDEVVEALKKNYYDKTAKDIHTLIAGNSGKIEGLKFEDLDKLMEREHFDSIANYQKVVSDPLSEDQIKDVIQGKPLPVISTPPSHPPSGSDADALNKTVDEILALTPKDEDKVSADLDKLKNLVNDDAKVAAIQHQEDLPAHNKKIDREMLIKILKAADAEALKEFSKPSAEDPVKAAAAPAVDPVSENDEKKQKEAAAAAAVDPVSQVAEEPQSAPDADAKLNDLAKIVSEVVGEKNFNDITEDKLNDLKLKLSKEQLAALKAANPSKNVDSILKILKEADAEKAKQSTPVDADAELKKVSDAVVAAIGEGKFNDITAEKLEALKLSKEQLDALKTKNPGKDVNILEILKGAKTIDAAGNSEGSSNNNSSEETAFYKTYWFMGASFVVLLAAIGGGAFVMTRKTEETDL